MSSAGLHRAEVFRHLRFTFAWRGISLQYLQAGAYAAAGFTLIFWFLPRLGFGRGLVPWWSLFVLAASIMAAVAILQWRRDPEYLGRKIVAWQIPQRLSPWLIGHRKPIFPWLTDDSDPILPLRERDLL